MELSIDFYSKQELAIRINFAGGYPFPANETSELFLFSCYTLRQFSNLGNHPLASVLAVLLTSFSKTTNIELARGGYQFPSPYSLGLLMGFHGVHININYDVLKDQILSEMPKLVDYRGQGKKIFTMTLPPLQLHHKGFGLLGFQVNYYVFHSVIALQSYLASRHIEDDVYLDHLSQVAGLLGKAQIARKVSIGDQATLANAILKDVGLID